MILTIVVAYWFTLGILGVYIGNSYDERRGIDNTPPSVLYAFAGVATLLAAVSCVLADGWERHK
jgi:hypothetical protein